MRESHWAHMQSKESDKMMQNTYTINLLGCWFECQSCTDDAGIQALSQTIMKDTACNIVGLSVIRKSWTSIKDVWEAGVCIFVLRVQSSI